MAEKRAVHDSSSSSRVAARGEVLVTATLGGADAVRAEGISCFFWKVMIPMDDLLHSINK